MTTRACLARVFFRAPPSKSRTPPPLTEERKMGGSLSPPKDALGQPLKTAPATARQLTGPPSPSRVARSAPHFTSHFFTVLSSEPLITRSPHTASAAISSVRWALHRPITAIRQL